MDNEMTEVEAVAFEPSLAPGSYSGTLVNISETVQDFGEGPKVRWAWRFTVHTDEGEVERTYWTGDRLTASTKAGRAAVALLGARPTSGDNILPDLIGRHALLVVDIDANGQEKVVDVIAQPRGAKA